jgi:hypothetical protein
MPAAVGSCDRLHALGPAPAGLHREPRRRRTAETNDVHPRLVRSSLFVRRLEVTLLNACHGNLLDRRLPTISPEVEQRRGCLFAERRPVLGAEQRAGGEVDGPEATSAGSPGRSSADGVMSGARTDSAYVEAEALSTVARDEKQPGPRSPVDRP